MATGLLTERCSRRSSERRKRNSRVGHASDNRGVAERPSPPKLLAELMAEDRAAGLSFDDVWLDNLLIAAGKPSSSWHTALEGTREAWRASFDNMPGPSGAVLSLDLLDDHADRVHGGAVLG